MVGIVPDQGFDQQVRRFLDVGARIRVIREYTVRTEKHVVSFDRHPAHTLTTILSQ